MMSEDIEVWSKYLASPVTPIKEVWYDVHVGQGVLLAVGADDIDRRIAAGVTRKRIDVVCHVGGGYWVVEIKPYAGFLALGQVLSYTRLFIKEYALPGQVFPVIVCDEVDDDVVDDFEEAGVLVVVND